MIVTCENCNTNFELDDELVRELGSEVTCSKCDHAFTVYSPGSAEGPEGVAEETPEQSLDLDFGDIDEEETEQSLDLDLGGAEEETPEQSLDLDIGDIETEETEQGLDPDLDGAEKAPEQSLDLDLSDEEGSGQADLDLDTLALDEGPPTRKSPDGQEELDLDALSRALEEEEPDDVEDEERDGVLDFDMLDEEEAPAEAELNLESLGATKEPEAESFSGLQRPPDEELPESFELEEEPAEASPDDASMASLEEPSAGARIEDIKEDEAPPRPTRVPPKIIEPSKKTIGTPVMIFLVVGLLAAGAFGAFGLLKRFDIRIPFVESLLGIDQEVTAVDPGNVHIALPDRYITSQYVTNENIGRLFVIQGKVRNNYDVSRNFIVVKAALFSKDGKRLRNATAYCGSVLSGSELETLGQATIDATRANKFGHERSNFGIPPGKEIPFMVLFSDVPADIGEFTVEVASSLPGE